MTDAQRTQAAEKAIGYAFKSPAILLQALTHKSYSYEHGLGFDNEKLEFLGDAILGFITARKLYFSGGSEGEMTKSRAALVSRVPLRNAVESLGILSLVRYGNGVKDSAFSDKAVSNVFEAVLAAVYLDSGSLVECEKFVFAHLFAEESEADYKSELQELLQSEKSKCEYLTCDVGDAHAHYFRAEVIVGGKKISQGEGKSKKIAEKQAAKNALIYYGKKVD